MARQEEPLYDFPEPTKPCQRKLLCPQRGRGSLRSISVLDRLLLTVPVWLQLSINPATALHILQREPPGTFLVRKSRTSKRKVLCVRLADDSVPSFVQQFGIREEQSTLSLETSAISFPDLPRLISFYCVSRDVLPFPLELPEAIAKAASHKELESISHMGIEFWSSHLNVRGPRDAPKPKKAEEKAAIATSVSPPALPDSPPHLDSNNRPPAAPEPDADDKKPDSNPTLFHEFCPITTRSPSELDCGAGQGALCFINPLFLQSQNALCRRRMFKRSLKVRVSTETLTQLSPPLAPPPPPPLMPKTKGRCKAQRRGEGAAADASQVQNPLSAPPHFLFEMQEEEHEDSDTDQSKAGVKEVSAQLLLDEYMTLPVNHPASLSPYHSPSVSPMAPPLFPKSSPVLPSHDSSSPYQSPSISPKAPSSPNHLPSMSSSLSSPHTEPVCGTPERESAEEEEEEHEVSDTDQSKAGVKEVSAQLPAIKEHLLDEYMTPPVNHPAPLSPYHSPSVSPMAPPLFPKSSPVLPSHDSSSPYQSPSISPKAPSSPNHLPSMSPSLSSPHTQQVCSTAERESAEEEEEEQPLPERNQDNDDKDLNEEESVELQMSAASLEDPESCSLNGDVEEAAEPSALSVNEQTVEASSEQT